LSVRSSDLIDLGYVGADRGLAYFKLNVSFLSALAKVGQRIDDNTVQVHLDRVVLEPVGDQAAVVVHIPLLRRDGDPLLVLRPLLGVILSYFSGRCLYPTVQQVGADHKARPPLARLAVDNCHVVRVILQPPIHIFTERSNLSELWRVVIVKGKGGNTRMELGDIVGALRAKVVDFVMVLVLLLQELYHVVHRVSVDTLQVLARKPHRDNTIADISEIKVEAIFDKSVLFFRHQSFDIRHI